VLELVQVLELVLLVRQVLEPQQAFPVLEQVLELVQVLPEPLVLRPSCSRRLMQRPLRAIMKVTGLKPSSSEFHLLPIKGIKSLI
jgi:hypothetical protein